MGGGAGVGTVPRLDGGTSLVLKGDCSSALGSRISMTTLLSKPIRSLLAGVDPMTTYVRPDAITNTKAVATAKTAASRRRRDRRETMKTP
jgi:hypothetical protein